MTTSFCASAAATGTAVSQRRTPAPTKRQRITVSPMTGRPCNTPRLRTIHGGCPVPFSEVNPYLIVMASKANKKVAPDKLVWRDFDLNDPGDDLCVAIDAAVEIRVCQLDIRHRQVDIRPIVAALEEGADRED